MHPNRPQGWRWPRGESESGCRPLNRKLGWRFRWMSAPAVITSRLWIMILNCAKPWRELEQIIITLQTRYVTPLLRRWLHTRWGLIADRWDWRWLGSTPGGHGGDTQSIKQAWTSAGDLSPVPIPDIRYQCFNTPRLLHLMLRHHAWTCQTWQKSWACESVRHLMS